MRLELEYFIQQFAIAHRKHNGTNASRENYQERCDDLLKELKNSTKEERAEAISLVLTSGNTIGHLISFVGGLYDRHRQHAYFNILEELTQDTFYQDLVVKILLHRNKNGLTIGNSFASQHWVPEMQYYLAILDKLLSSEKEDDVLQILLRQTYGMTTAALISKHQNAETTNALLNIINKLLNLRAAGVWKLLLHPAKEDGRTMGHLIARHQEAEVIYDYLIMVIPFVDSNRDKVLDVLAEPAKDGRAMGHLIARHQNAEVMRTYLKIITLFVQSNREWVLNVLTQPAKNGQTMGHLIAYYQKATVMRAYLVMLKQLLIANKEDVLDLLNKQSKDGWTLGHLIKYYQNTEIQKDFGELIAAIFITMPSHTDNEIKQYTYLKPMIAKYLLQLKDNPKNREILEGAIKQDNLLGALCHKPTGTGFYKRLVHGNTDNSSCLVIDIKAKLEEFKNLEEFKSDHVEDIEMTVVPCKPSALKLRSGGQKIEILNQLENVDTKSCDLGG